MLKRLMVPLLAGASLSPVVANTAPLPLHLEQLSIAQHKIVNPPEYSLSATPRTSTYHWNKVPSIHIKRNRSLERRIAKIGRPRFDHYSDERVLWVPSIYEPAGFNPDWLYTEESVRAVERTAGRTASAVGGEYLKPVEELFEWTEEWINRLLKRAHLSYDSREKQKRKKQDCSYFKASVVLEFNQDHFFGFEGRWQSRLGRIKFEFFPDQTTLNYRLIKVDGGELYLGIYNSFEHNDHGVTLHLTLPFSTLIGRARSSR